MANNFIEKDKRLAKKGTRKKLNDRRMISH